MSKPRDHGVGTRIDRWLVRRILADLEMMVGFVEVHLPTVDQRAKMPEDVGAAFDHAAARVKIAEEHMRQLAGQAGVAPDEDLDD